MRCIDRVFGRDGDGGFSDDLGVDRFRGRVDWATKVSVLSDALPYVQKFCGQTFVVKYGGSAMVDQELADAFAQDVVMLRNMGVYPIVVHGGAPMIQRALKERGLPDKCVDGLRITDSQTMEVVEMVLSGAVNKEIVGLINSHSGAAVGVSCKDANLVTVKKLVKAFGRDGNVSQIVDLGFVGEPQSVNPDLLFLFSESDYIPVISPVSKDAAGVTYNVNADSIAGAIAGAVSASKLVILTDQPGVLDADGNLISSMTVAEANKLLANGVVTKGMIPKLQTCIAAVSSGCESVHILGGSMPHALLLEFFTSEGVGTMVVER